MRTVVDGSVAAKWYFAEPGHEAADRILAAGIAGERELFAPDLIVPEFVNVLWKRVRRRECSRAAAAEILGLWDVDRPLLVASSELAARAFELRTSSTSRSTTACTSPWRSSSTPRSRRRTARSARSRLERVELIS
jgi:predicted nucleic acid-binding protein